MVRVDIFFSPHGNVFSVRLQDPLLKSQTQDALHLLVQFLYKYIGRGEKEGSRDVCKVVVGTRGM